MLEHGGNLRAAARRYGRDDWIDLSTGINPWGYPVPPLAADAWHRLPEPDPALVEAACRYYGASPLLPVAGTQAAIQALPRLRPPSRVTVSAPSYAEHAHHWGRHGHTLRRSSYAALDSAVDDSDVLVVCNPNNPTGETVAPAQLLDWAARLARRGGWLIVDEAFGDTAPALGVAAHAPARCLQPGLGHRLPGLVVQCRQRDRLRRAADGPGSEQVGECAQQACVGCDKAQPQAGQSEEFTDRAQHDQARCVRMAGDAERRCGIAKGFVDN